MDGGVQDLSGLSSIVEQIRIEEGGEKASPSLVSSLASVIKEDDLPSSPVLVDKPREEEEEEESFFYETVTVGAPAAHSLGFEQGRFGVWFCVYVYVSLSYLRLSLSYLRLSLSYLRLSLSYLRLSLSYLRLSLSYLRLSLSYLRLSLSYLRLSLSSCLYHNSFLPF